MDAARTAKTEHGRFRRDQCRHNYLTPEQVNGTGRPLNVAGICMFRGGA